MIHRNPDQGPNDTEERQFLPYRQTAASAAPERKRSRHYLQQDPARKAERTKRNRLPPHCDKSCIRPTAKKEMILDYKPGEQISDNKPFRPFFEKTNTPATTFEQSSGKLLQ